MKKLLTPTRYKTLVFKFDLKMKLTSVLILITFFTLHANETYSQKTKVTLDLSNVMVSQIIDEIENQTDFRFVYKIKEVDLKRITTIKAKNEKITAILDQIFGSTETTYDIIDKQIFLKKKELASPKEITNNEIKNTQQLVINGKITDASAMSMAGVLITIEGSIKAVTSDFDGSYEIRVPNDDTVLVFSNIGFTTQKIKVGTQKTINVTLIASITKLEEVVLVGYGETKKKDLTGSVGTIMSKDMADIQIQTIDQAIAGKIPGAYALAVGGNPGAGSIIHIRGLSSLTGDNQPLYVIDGVPIVINPNFGGLQLGFFAQRENPLLAINPSDVERIDILKDASAAAIYGSRAANGVILVTTKRGKKNQKPKFSFSSTYTYQNPTKTYKALNASQYKTFTTGLAKDFLSQFPEPLWSGFEPQYSIVTNPDSFYGKQDTNWQELVTNKSALWTQYNFNVSGGSEKINYLTSLNAVDQEGTLIGTRFNRYTLSTNIDAQISERITIGTSINYNNSVNKLSGIRSLSQAINFRPDVGVFNENGTYTSSPLFGGLFGNFFTRNPIGGNAKVSSKAVSQNILGSVYGEYQLIDNLRFKSAISINKAIDKTTLFNPSFTDAVLYDFLFSGNPLAASLQNSGTDTYNKVFSNTLAYNKTFEKHFIDAVVGVSWDSSRIDLDSQTYSGFPDDEILVNIASANRVTRFSSESVESGLNSLFGRLNYIYADKYLATITVRRDGSTKFGPNNQFGIFPSAALAWNVNKENFLKDSKIINQLKLRTSFGRTGSDNLPSFSYLAYVASLQLNNSIYSGLNGTAVTGLPNPNIKWEQTNQLDIGLEYSFFNRRINGELVYFKKNTSGIILLTPVPFETGFSSYNSNLADVSNKGWEISLGVDIVRTKNFSWNTKLNVSFIKNKVDALYGGKTTNANTTNEGIREGSPIGVIFGYDVVGIAQTQEEIYLLNSTAPSGFYFQGLTKPGDYIYKDTNNDGQITVNDRKVLGDINPDYFGGWDNTFRYKNFDFSFGFQFVQGKEKVWGETEIWFSGIDLYQNAPDIVLDTWSAQNTTANYARVGSRTHGGILSPTSKEVQDASFVRLRTISLGYNLPKRVFDKTAITSGKLFLNANNILTFTRYKGLDPETADQSIGGFGTIGLVNNSGTSYPINKTFSIGINLNF
jgi:TonB-dependent starch-binding outer membrane protein SusC